MTFGEYKAELIKKLHSLYTNAEAKAVASLVIEKISDMPASAQHSLEKKELALPEFEKINSYEKELLTGRPVQYVLGEAWFLDKKFYVNESVLIPRPETEELVLWVKHFVAQHKMEAPSLLDVGTGSGCIPISLCRLIPEAKITAIDISKKALEVAMGNAATHKVDIQWGACDFLNRASWPAMDPYDIIVSNPPYIPEKEKQKMDANVVDWEPSEALFTPDNHPFIFYEALEAFSHTHLKRGGAIFMEGHQDYIQQVAALFNADLFQVTTRKDIHGNERLVCAEKK